jgi:penicillin amidase
VRWSAYASLAVALLLVAGSVSAVRAVRASFPQTTGTLDLPGLDHEVRVLRDDAGVPQVYASTPHDLFLAQGFVQAQDRFYEMDVRRHLTAGRLSELFGSRTLDADKVVRALGWRRVAEREVAQLDRDTQAHLAAFSDGVNAYLADRSPGDIALEYTLLSLGGLDYSPEAWTPAVSVSWLKAMAWDLRGDMQDEVDRALMSTRLDPAEIDELYPDYPYDRHATAIPGRAAGRPAPATTAGRVPALAALVRVRDALDHLPVAVGAGAEIGSNAWAVDGAHSATGEPLLANDPHLTTSLPGVWYQMGLHCEPYGDACPYDVSGFTFAGFPGVVIGHNRDIAWGMSNLRPDTTDLYLEGVDGDRYRRGARWVPFARRTETIRVAGEDAYTFTVRSTVHGPVLSDVGQTYATVGANAPDGGFGRPGSTAPDGPYAVSLAWTALRPSRTAASILALDRATDWESFREALRGFAAPAQNVVYADRAGHIGLQVAGRLPMRPRDVSGADAKPGWLPRLDWSRRTVPFDDLPSELDPADGLVVSANQPPLTPPTLPGLVTTNGYGYRSQRIRDVLEDLGTGGKVTADDLRALQLDSRNDFAAVLVPYLLRVGVGGPYYSAGPRLLEHWDHTQPRRSPAAAYYNAVWRQLLLLTFGDQLPASVPINGGERWFEVVRSILDQPRSHWWDDVRTDVVEDRDTVLREAMRTARDELTRLQSRRAARWTWGHQHRLELRDQTLGEWGNGLVRRLLDRGGWHVGGGPGTVDATGWDVREGFTVTAAPSMRMVVSLADLDDSSWVNLTGASGHAFSAHYTDQTDLWAAGRTRPWPFTPRAVRAAAEDVLVLRPANLARAPRLSP